MSNPQVDTVELTPRRCRYCRQPFLAAKGERPHACHGCAPTIDDAIAGRIPATLEAPAAAPGRAAPPPGLRLLDSVSGRSYPLPGDGIPF